MREGTKLRIAVIGAGTAGAASAIFLARAGHQVSLFERVAQPAAVGAGILLQPTGLAVLDSLGLLHQVLGHGARIGALFGTNPKGRHVLDVRYSDWNAQSFGLGLHRGALFTILWNALHSAGVEVSTGVSVDHLAQTTDEASLFEAGRKLGSYDCVVLADGTRSELRASLAIRQRVDPYPWGALWAMVPDDGMYPGLLRQWFRGSTQMLGLMPTGHAYGSTTAPLLSLFWSLPSNALAQWQASGLQAWKKTLLELAPIEKVLEHITDASQLSFASYSDVQMRKWHHQRVVCIGDCAHATSPQLGQGANLALIDARELARSLADAADVPNALAQYSQRRRDHVRYYQRSSRWLTPFFQSHSRLAGSLRDIFLGPLCRAPYLRRQMAQTLSGTKSGFIWGHLES